MREADDPEGVLETARRIREGDVSAVDVAEAAVARVGDDRLNAFLDFDTESILATAAAVDAKRTAGQTLGPLAGVPIAVKDNLSQTGRPMTCASRILEGYVPPFDAAVVERLKAADAVCFGKTNLDEFAMGASGENSAFGPTLNPWGERLSPGGSSSGSAAAVGGRLVPASLGSDTGGSIRQPAALCGCVGIKPTYGRVSRYGLVAFASSLDQIGPFASSVADAAAVLQAIAGHDRRDMTSVDRPVDDYLGRLGDGASGLRVGVVDGFGMENLDPGVTGGVSRAADVLRDAGARVEPVTLPNVSQNVAVYYVIAPSEASGNLARFDGMHYGRRAELRDGEALDDLYARSRGEGFGPEVKRRLMIGTFALSSGYYDAYYKTALKVRRLITRDFDRALATYDLLLSPVTPHPAFAIGAGEMDPMAMYLDDIFSIGANLAGLPAMSVPVGLASQLGGTAELPVGVQLVAARFAETTLLRGAAAIEATVDPLPPPR